MAASADLCCHCDRVDVCAYSVLANYLIWLLLMDLAPETSNAFKQHENDYRRVLQVSINHAFRLRACMQVPGARAAVDDTPACRYRDKVRDWVLLLD